MNNTNKQINIVAQAFYGNRVGTEIKVNDMDRFILGYLDSSLPVTEKIDRTIIKIPNEDGIVIVYNKYEEEEEFNSGHELNPLAVIDDIKIYSRCIACRINNDGEFESLRVDDYEKVVKYFAE